MPLTLAMLALFTAAIVLLRIRWSTVPPRLKRFLILSALGPLIVVPCSVAMRLNIIEDHLNALVYWGFVLGYIFFASLFTLLRPIWLTSLVAIVVVIPFLSANAILPLAAIFSTQPHTIKPLGDGLVADLTPIDAVTSAASGTDLIVYRRISWAPFLQRKVQGARYFNTQCDTSAAYTVLQPDHQHFRMVCPASPGAPPTDRRDLIVKIYPH